MLKNPEKIKDKIVEWIRKYFKENGKDCFAVIGISGGKDSTIAAALCVEALGKQKVFGVLMPNGVQKDIDDAYEVVKHLDIPHIIVNINEIYTSLCKTIVESTHSDFTLSEQAMVNIPPRIRMTILYAIAQSLPNGGRVVNTCNLSEDYVGYSTKFGDSVGDFAPLADLLVSEVKQIGYTLNLPKVFIEKIPADGLCSKTDEDNLGFTYDELEDYMVYGNCGNDEKDNLILTKHIRNMHKLQPMPKYELSADDVRFINF